MRLYLARGHGVQPSGVHDPGAVGGGWTEQTAADHVAPACAAVLSAAGVDVTDEGVDDPNYVGSVRAANGLGADLFVALHFDWTGGLDVHAFHHSKSSPGTALAASIVHALAGAGAPIEDNPVRARDGLYVISATTMPAVLVELGRIGADHADTPEELQALGRAVGRGILDHLNIPVPEDDMPLTDADLAAIHDTVQDAVFRAGFGRTNPESFGDRVGHIRVDTRDTRALLVSVSKALTSLSEQVDAIAAGDPSAAHTCGAEVREALAAAGEALAALDDEPT